jgi:hypothetical protein
LFWSTARSIRTRWPDAPARCLLRCLLPAACGLLLLLLAAAAAAATLRRSYCCSSYAAAVAPARRADRSRADGGLGWQR